MDIAQSGRQKIFQTAKRYCPALFSTTKKFQNMLLYSTARKDYHIEELIK